MRLGNKNRAFITFVAARKINPVPTNSKTRPGIPCKTSSEGSCLCDDGAGGGRLVLPGGRDDTDRLVVAGQTVDTGLDENQAELGVLVLAVALEVLADGDGLLDEVPEVLRDAGREAFVDRQSRGRRRRGSEWRRARARGRRRGSSSRVPPHPCPHWLKKGGRTVGLQDTEDLVAREEAHLWDAVRVAEGDTDLGWCEALARQLADVVNDVLGRGLEP